MRSVLVTGASRGLGRAIATEFAAARWFVAANYLSSHAEAQALAQQTGAMLLRGDVSCADDVRRMFGEIREHCGTLGVLVNNAGITHDALVLRTPEQAWQRVLEVNLKAVALCSTQAAAMMTAGGHIVNISSMSAVAGRAGQAAYATAKAALIGLTRSLAAELGPRGICVNAILPGYLPAGMGRAAETALERAKAESVLARLGDPAEAARFIVHLCGMRAVSGQVLSLDSRLWGLP